VGDVIRNCGTGELSSDIDAAIAWGQDTDNYDRTGADDVLRIVMTVDEEYDEGSAISLTGFGTATSSKYVQLRAAASNVCITFIRDGNNLVITIFGRPQESGAGPVFGHIALTGPIRCAATLLTVVGCRTTSAERNSVIDVHVDGVARVRFYTNPALLRSGTLPVNRAVPYMPSLRASITVVLSVYGSTGARPP